MFSQQQQSAVKAIFTSADFEGDLQVLPEDSGDEIVFILDVDDVLRLDVVVLERELSQVLHRKVWIEASIEDSTVPFA